MAQELSFKLEAPSLLKIYLHISLSHEPIHSFVIPDLLQQSCAVVNGSSSTSNSILPLAFVEFLDPSKRKNGYMYVAYIDLVMHGLSSTLWIIFTWMHISHFTSII